MNYCSYHLNAPVIHLKDNFECIKSVETNGVIVELYISYFNRSFRYTTNDPVWGSKKYIKSIKSGKSAIVVYSLKDTDLGYVPIANITAVSVASRRFNKMVKSLQSGKVKIVIN